MLIQGTAAWGSAVENISSHLGVEWKTLSLTQNRTAGINPINTHSIASRISGGNLCVGVVGVQRAAGARD